MAGLPTVQVLLDNGAGAFPYDITSRCRIKYRLTRGRQDEQSDVTPGQIRSLVLDNTDGRFTLGSTVIASPSPIRVDNRIRIKVTANAVTRDRFTGYVQDWPTEWPTGSDTLCEVTVSATDAQARAERRTLRSVIEEEIMEDLPPAYYTLGERAGALSAADSSGNQAPALTMFGTGANVVFGTDTGPGTDGLTAATFAGGKRLRTLLPLGTAPTLIFAFVVSSAARMYLANTYSTSTLAQQIALIIDTGVLSLGGGNLNGGAGGYNDGKVHTIAVRMTSSTTADVYIDGVLTDSAFALVGIAINADALILGGGPDQSAALTGAIAHAAVWATGAVPSGARLIAEQQAMLTGFAGESGTARINRTAGYGNIPIGTLDTSLTNVAFQDISGTSAADQLRDIADAEVGLIFFDGAGNLTFHNRNRPAIKTSPDITITADQLSPGTLIPVDMQGVVNYFAVTAVGTGVEQVVRNTISENGDGTVTNPGHGRYPDSKTYLVQTDAEALDRGNWVVGNHAEPLPRIPTLTIDLLPLDAATQSALLAAEANTWIRVTGLLSQTPGGTTADLMVQGFAEDIAPDAWQIALNVVARSTFQAWILGDATYGVLGSTTRLAV